MVLLVVIIFINEDISLKVVERGDNVRSTCIDNVDYFSLILLISYGCNYFLY